MSIVDQVKIVTNVLDEIIELNVDSFKNGSFKVRPNYGYAKFYLDRVDGSHDMSLHSLIHYIMYDKGIYKKILNKDQYADLEEVVSNEPESIYGPDDEYQSTQDSLDSIYWESISFVKSKLTELGFNVDKSFSEYLD